MTEEQFWQLIDKLTKKVVENENCVLNIMCSTTGFVEIQLIPSDLWFEGANYE